MAERWQQWMPFHIDRFRGSPDVQAMHPVARIGYLYLLASAWQTDDCTVPNDPLALASLSGLGDDLWVAYAPRILRKFEDTGAGRLSNSVLKEEWLDAKRVFEARSNAAKRTTNLRTPKESDTVTEGKRHGHRTVTERSPLRSADTITGTGTTTGTGTKSVEPAPEPNLDELVPAIVCSHPRAVTKRLQPHQVTNAQMTAVIEVLATDHIPAPELLAKVQAISHVVLAEWPPGEFKYLASIERFFREREFNRPIEEWKLGDRKAKSGRGQDRTDGNLRALSDANATDGDP